MLNSIQPMKAYLINFHMIGVLHGERVNSIFLQSMRDLQYCV